MSVKRYRLSSDGCDFGFFPIDDRESEPPEGEYVEYSDYAALLAENERIRKLFEATERLTLLDGEYEAAKAGTYNRLNDELQCLKAATTWRPIETAPKDGTAVLLFLEYTECDDGAGRKSTHIDRCYWSDAEKGWDGYATSIRNGYTTPTHWMPLPKPPSA